MQRAAESANSGVIYQNVDSAPCRFNPLGGGRHGVDLSYIASNDFRSALTLGDGLCRVFEGGARTSAQHRGGTHAGEFARYGRADAAACAGDDCDLRVQSSF
jgi:hypothetical protein